VHHENKDLRQFVESPFACWRQPNSPRIGLPHSFARNGAKLRFSHGNQGKNYIDVGGIKSGVVDKDCPTPDQNLSRTGDERDLVRFASINEALMKLSQRIVSAYTAKRTEKQCGTQFYGKYAMTPTRGFLGTILVLSFICSWLGFC